MTGSSTASFTASSTTLSGGTNPSGIYAPYQTFYTYSATGELAKVTEGAQTRTYNYDGLGRLTSSALPEDGTTQFTYTDFGAVNTRTDARGVIASYAYDGLHRLTAVTYNVGNTGVPPTPSVNYTYGSSPSSNNNGRLVTMTDGLGSETYFYDVMGRTTQLSRIINGATYNIGYAYNTAGELSSLTYPSGRVVQPSYDSIGRMTQIASGGTNYLSGMSYNSAQLPTGFNYGNGVQASFGYNDHLELSTLAYTSGSSTLLNLTYNYGTGNNGQIQGVTDSRGAAYSTSYSYDTTGRLSQAQTNDLASANTWRLAWSYDRYGNRLSQTLTGGAASVGQPQLTVDPNTNYISTSGFTYDASGNMTKDVSHSYTYNGQGEITQIDATTSYAYDGHRWRAQKTINGTSTVYIYSGSKVLAEYPGGGAASSPNVEYIYSGSKLLATITGTAVTYHHSDHLSNRVETNSSGGVTRTFGQLPFGDAWFETGMADKWKFTGYEHDAESGLDYAMNRFYNSGYGRFMSTDLRAGSLMNPQSLNRYAYVLNDPVNLTDPLGLETAPGTPPPDPGSGLPPGSNIGDPFANAIACALFGAMCPDPGPPLFEIGGGHEGGGGGAGAGKDGPGKNKVDLARLADCIWEQFQVELTSFVPSVGNGAGDPSNSNGSFTGIGLDTFKGNPGADITVINDIHTKTLTDLNSEETPTPYTAREPGSSFAATYGSDPYVNYSSDGAVGDSFVLNLQIHELGNSLSVITGQYSGEALKNSRSDPGQQTEDCYNQAKK